MALHTHRFNNLGINPGDTAQLRVEYRLDNGKKLLPGLRGRVLSVSRNFVTIQTNPDNKATIHTLPNYALVKVRDAALVGGS